MRFLNSLSRLKGFAFFSFLLFAQWTLIHFVIPQLFLLLFNIHFLTEKFLTQKPRFYNDLSKQHGIPMMG